MADYRISVDTKVNTEKLDKLEQRIKSFNNKPIKVNVDLTVDGSDITRQINKQIGGKLGVKANLDVGFDGKSLNKAMSQAKNMVNKSMSTSKGTRFFPFEDQQYLKTLANNINKSVSKISNLSLSKGFHSNEIKGELANLRSYVNVWDKIVDEIDPSIIDSKLKQSIAETQNNIDRLFSSFENKKLDLNIAEQVSAEAAKADEAFNKMRSQLKRAYSFENKLVGVDVGSDEYKELQHQIEDAYRSAAMFRSEISGGLTSTMFDQLNADAKECNASIELTKAKLNDIERNANRKKADAFFNDSKKYSKLDRIDERFGALDNVSRKLKTVKTELDDMRHIMPEMLHNYSRTGDADALLSFADKYNDKLKKMNGLLESAEIRQRTVNRRTKQSNASLKLDNAKKTFGLQIDAWMSKNTAAIETFGDRLNGIKARISDVDSSASLASLRSEFQQTTLEAKVMGKATLTVGDRLKEQAKQYGSYLGVAALTAAGGQALRMMSKNVLEVDTAMTGLYRVTDLTAEQYDKLYANMISSSKEYGATLTDTINATSDWVRAGFDADTALGLADITAMYQHISDLDYGEASKNLLTAYKGFEDSFSKDFGSGSSGVLGSVEHVADVFNELDNKFSVTSAGLGEGLARSASALELAGNTFEQSAAMVGAISEVTQDPEKSGNALKTLSLRLRGEVFLPPYNESYMLCAYYNKH